MYRVQAIGNMTADPEPWKEFNGEPAAKFRVAANNIRGGKKVVAYFSCTAFGGIAKFALNYLRKGSPVYLEGEPSIFVGKDGKGYYDLTVRVLESMSNRSTSSGEGLSSESSVRSVPPAPFESADTVDMTAEFLRTGAIKPPAPEPVENVKLPWDDGSGDDSDLPF